VGACRVPAADLETIVENNIRVMLADETVILDAAGPVTVAERKSLIEHARSLAERWPELPASDRRAILNTLIERIEVQPQTVGINTNLH
jgi:acyl-CoA reductase-like NAD-dependent aldehyde dehydrogenase